MRKSQIIPRFVRCKLKKACEYRLSNVKQWQKKVCLFSNEKEDRQQLVHPLESLIYTVLRLAKVSL